MPLTPPKLLYQTHQATTQRRSTLQSLVLVILAHLTFIPITVVFWWPRSIVLSVCMSYIFMTSVMVIVMMSRVRLSRVVVW
jgi:ABC-type multidrug transport system permease subunit